MISRRSVLLAGVALAPRPLVAGLPVPAGSTMAFRLVRHGSEIGRHTLSFSGGGSAGGGNAEGDAQRDARADDQAGVQDGTMTVRVAVDALVSLVSVPLVRYKHRAVETWQNGRLVGLVGQTDKNGQQEWMNARRTSEGLVVLGSKTARYIAPETAIGTTYWNKRMVDGPMISLEDGVLLRPNVAVHRAEPIKLASGGTITADHYALTGAFAIDVWYDQTNTWAGLAFGVADGSVVRYERL